MYVGLFTLFIYDTILMRRSLMKNLKKVLFVVVFIGSLTLAHSQNSQMSFRYGFFYVKFLFFNVVCVVYL